MAYCTSTDVKVYGGWADSDAGDDVLLGVLIPYAEEVIDTYTGRTFEYDDSSSDNEVARTFDAEADVRDDYTLMLDKDLHKIGLVTIDGQAISSDSYVTEPRSDAPYWGITLLSSSSDTWDYGTDSENAIEVYGHWAYSSDAPADIKLAIIMLVDWLKKMRNSDIALTAPVITESGAAIMPVQMPNIVANIISRYKRVTFEVVPGDR